MPDLVRTLCLHDLERETCSYCGAGYHPKRKPRGVERRFCSKCRRAGIPQRLASRDYAERKARAK